MSECATCGTERYEFWIEAPDGTLYCGACGGTECELCDRPIERGDRLCPRCVASCKAHGPILDCSHTYGGGDGHK